MKRTNLWRMTVAAVLLWVVGSYSASAQTTDNPAVAPSAERTLAELDRAPVIDAASMNYRFDPIKANAGANEAEVSFSMPEDEMVTIQVYLPNGRLASIAKRDAPYAAGAHTEKISLERLPAGAYMVTVTMGMHTRTQPLVVVR